MFKHYKDQATGNIYTLETDAFFRECERLRSLDPDSGFTEQEIAQIVVNCNNPLVEIEHAEMLQTTAASRASMIANLISATRAKREAVFARLAGHQSQALSDGDTDKAKAISNVQTELAEMTSVTFAGASTAEELVAVVAKEWERISALAPVSVQAAFK